jgi:hypothetical protein
MLVASRSTKLDPILIDLDKLFSELPFMPRLHCLGSLLHHTVSWKCIVVHCFVVPIRTALDRFAPRCVLPMHHMCICFFSTIFVLP